MLAIRATNNSRTTILRKVATTRNVSSSLSSTFHNGRSSVVAHQQQQQQRYYNNVMKTKQLESRGRLPTIMQQPQAIQQQLQQTQSRRNVVHIAPLVGLWGIKHLSMWTIYNACKSYGWPKVYRRLLEYNRSLYNANRGSLQQQQTTQRIIRMAIEEPPKFAQQISTNYNKYIQPLFQHIIDTSSKVSSSSATVAGAPQIQVPSFTIELIKYVINSAKPIKILNDFVNVTGTAGKTATSSATAATAVKATTKIVK